MAHLIEVPLLNGQLVIFSNKQNNHGLSLEVQQQSNVVKDDWEKRL